jgi:ribosomal protein L10
MSERVVTQRKLDYRARLERYFEEYRAILIFTVDNVGSSQLQKIRLALRGKGAMLLGKNTIIRKVVREVGAPRLPRSRPPRTTPHGRLPSSSSTPTPSCTSCFLS